MRNQGGRGATAAVSSYSRHTRLKLTYSKPRKSTGVAQANAAIVDTAAMYATVGSARNMDHENDPFEAEAHNFKEGRLFTVLNRITPGSNRRTRAE